jgi:threonyl-tRNA synthetase
MIHRALFGSIERFFGVLLEHYAGAFPTWLAPVQVVVIPIADRHHEYGERVAAALGAAGLRVETDASGETLGNRIRKAQGSKVPYMLVVGDKEAGAGTVAIRGRSGDKRNDVPLETFVAEVADEVARRGASVLTDA